MGGSVRIELDSTGIKDLLESQPILDNLLEEGYALAARDPSGKATVESHHSNYGGGRSVVTVGVFFDPKDNPLGGE